MNRLQRRLLTLADRWDRVPPLHLQIRHAQHGHDQGSQFMHLFIHSLIHLLLNSSGSGHHSDLGHWHPHPLHGVPHAARPMVQEEPDDPGRGQQVELPGTDQ